MQIKGFLRKAKHRFPKTFPQIPQNGQNNPKNFHDEPIHLADSYVFSSIFLVVETIKKNEHSNKECPIV